MQARLAGSTSNSRPRIQPLDFLLQTQLGKLDRTALVDAGAHINHTLSAEVDAGGLRRRTGVINDDAADPAVVLYIAEPAGHTAIADVIGDDVAIRVGTQKRTNQKVVSPLRLMLGL